MKKINPSIRLIYLCFVLFLISLAASSQESSDFQTIQINKQNKDFPVKYNCNTPMDAYVSINYIMANGKQGLWRSYSTYRFYCSFAKESTPDKEVSEITRNEILNRIAKECIIYKDSTAAIISVSENDSIYDIRYLSCEKGKWLNAGNDARESFQKTRDIVIGNLPRLASYIPMIDQLKQTPIDTINFINYIKKHGKAPRTYVLEKLAKHKVVVYGEAHRRKISWDLLKEVIQSPDFVNTTGTVFFELPSHKQQELDLFYAKQELDIDILLDVFGCEQINGWHDKDEFDFMIALRELNMKLPENQKIKVVLTDYQTQWGSIKTEEELKSFPQKNRNTNMADVIEQTLKESSDTRNSLFIVGYMHAYKSHVPGLFSGKELALTAGAQLVEHFSDRAVFSIFPHCPTISNSGTIDGKIRNGLYDYVFEVNNNIPIAFDLADSLSDVSHLTVHQK